MKSSVDLTQALTVARQAAQAGAEVAMRSRASRENIHVKEKGTADWVTDVDFAAQAAVISVIRAAFPDHRILAEEEGMDVSGDPSSPYQWIVDPLTERCRISTERIHSAASSRSGNGRRSLRPP